jgi:hypothetical protein
MIKCWERLPGRDTGCRIRDTGYWIREAAHQSLKKMYVIQLKELRIKKYKESLGIDYRDKSLEKERAFFKLHIPACRPAGSPFTIHHSPVLDTRAKSYW